jgi:hypothetical protein
MNGFHVRAECPKPGRNNRSTSNLCGQIIKFRKGCKGHAIFFYRKKRK